VSLRLPILFRRASDRSRPPKVVSSSARLAGMSDHAVSDAVEIIEDREKLCGWVVVFGVVLESFPKLIAFLGTPSIPLFREIIGGALVALGAVSYTHLDVYKRQLDEFVADLLQKRL